MTTARRVDEHQIRTNQSATIILLVLAFVLDLPVIAAVTGIIMLVSALYPPAGVFSRIHRHILLPLGVVQPNYQLDNPEPHRFAQLVGGTMVSLGALALFGSVTVLGWALVAIVIALANLNLFAGWCAGCTMYYWLNRLGVPGFTRSRIEVS